MTTFSMDTCNNWIPYSLEMFRFHLVTLTLLARSHLIIKIVSIFIISDNTWCRFLDTSIIRTSISIQRHQCIKTRKSLLQLLLNKLRETFKAREKFQFNRKCKQAENRNVRDVFHPFLSWVPLKMMVLAFHLDRVYNPLLRKLHITPLPGYDVNKFWGKNSGRIHLWTSHLTKLTKA